ncbi:hypothetical protein O6B72_01970 [Campylobacter ureolyticus]|uniref:hypothetical protein n=1 Tax=Campylobacter ureolyticus TaxID=827 RepID=UPI0022B5BF66|nr:hypothetical protein [Campylobacter ureolyticus]MCZ6155589.1 hypothetical protein [Campylobacter ureolyticus]
MKINKNFTQQENEFNNKMFLSWFFDINKTADYFDGLPALYLEQMHRTLILEWNYEELEPSSLYFQILKKLGEDTEFSDRLEIMYKRLPQIVKELAKNEIQKLGDIPTNPIFDKQENIFIYYATNSKKYLRLDRDDSYFRFLKMWGALCNYSVKSQKVHMAYQLAYELFSEFKIKISYQDYLNNLGYEIQKGVPDTYEKYKNEYKEMEEYFKTNSD